jgi:basic membrane protein A and related proteins
LKPSQFFSRRQVLQGSAALAGAALLPGRSRASQTLPPVNPHTMTIAFGHVGPITDQGWSWTHHQGRLAIAAAYPGAKFLEVESIPFSAKGSRTIRQFAAQGSNLVILNTDYGDISGDTIKHSPDIAFLECGSDKHLPNLRTYYVEHWNPSYIIGMAAGLLTKTGKLGYVGAYQTPIVNASINSFHLGARSVNPRVETKAVFINSWFDPQAAGQAGHALIGGGCDFLFGIMDEAAYLQVAEQAGVWAAMWNTDMRRFGPQSYVSSVMLDWKKYYVDQVSSLVAGTWQGGAMDSLPLGAGVDRDAWGDKVPPDVRRKCDAMRDKIMGGFNPFIGPMKDSAGVQRLAAGETMTRQTLYGWPWLLEGVTGSA